MSWLPITDTIRCDGEKRSMCHILLDSFRDISSGKRGEWDDLDLWCMHHLDLTAEHCTKRLEYLSQKMSSGLSLYEVLVLDMVDAGRRSRSIIHTLPSGEVISIMRKHNIEIPRMFDDDLPTRKEIYYTSDPSEHIGEDAAREKWKGFYRNRSPEELRRQAEARKEWARTNIISAPIGG